MTLIKSRIISAITLLAMLLLPWLPCHAQKYCQQVTAEFTDANAPENLKQLTVELLNKHLKAKKQQADIKLDNGSIVAKMPCNGNDVVRDYFYHEKFAIYETYDATELGVAIDRIARINDSLVENTYNYPLPFDKMLDRNFAYGACIGSCRIGYMEQFEALLKLPESRKLLPQDITLAFGIPEKGATAVPVFVVKTPKKSNPPVTIDMMKDAGTIRSFNKINYDVQLEFKSEYKATWEALTTKNANKSLAIMLGDRVLSCPTVLAPIANGKAAISANMDQSQAETMAQRINMSLPLEIVITEVKML